MSENNGSLILAPERSRSSESRIRHRDASQPRGVFVFVMAAVPASLATWSLVLSGASHRLMPGAHAVAAADHRCAVDVELAEARGSGLALSRLQLGSYKPLFTSHMQGSESVYKKSLRHEEVHLACCCCTPRRLGRVLHLLRNFSRRGADENELRLPTDQFA